MHEKTIIFKTNNQDIRVSYSIEGKGSAVVFLHGFLFAKEIWNSTIKELSSLYTCIAIDLLGHGKTGNLGNVHSMESMAEAVHAVLLAEKITECQWIGHSMGGYVALAYANLYPEAVSALCLLHSTDMADTAERKTEREKFVKIVQKDFPLVIEHALPNLLAHPNEEIIKEIKKISQKTSIQGAMAASLGMKDRLDQKKVWEKIKGKKMFILGEKDQLISVVNIQNRLLKNSEIKIKVLDDTGHLGFYENFSITIDAIREFLA